MAQMASRASIDYFVVLAIKGRIEALAKAGQGDSIVEEAFVIRTFRNGLGVFVSK
jgi:exosome complex exonuclease DIS3/RRP44